MSSTTKTAAAPVFTGEMRHKVEGKNRITIPASWRFDEEVRLYMIPKSDKACLSVMTTEDLERLKRGADALSPIDRSDFLAMLGGCIREVTMDKGGRISLPEEFFPLLGLPDARELYLVGALTTFEIWGARNFEVQKAGIADRQNALKRMLGI